METPIMSVETFKGEMSKFHSWLQAEGELYTEFGEASGGGRFPGKWKLLASDRLLPRYTFPTEGDTFSPPLGRNSLRMADEIGKLLVTPGTKFQVVALPFPRWK